MVLLIGLPLFLVSAGATFGFTKNVNAVEGIGRTMGSGQALLTLTSGPGSTTLQNYDGSLTGDLRGPGTSAPLVLPGKAARPSATDIRRVTGGAVLPVTTAETRVRVGERNIRARVIGIDGRRSAYAGMATLTSGHWPTAPDQVLVSRAGAASGVPTEGTLTLVDDQGRTRQVTVVGRASTPKPESIIELPRGRAQNWILQRNAPVAWPEVRQLNRYGLSVRSREVITHPAAAKADPVEQAEEVSNALPNTVWILLGTGLVIVIALLAGPAFAASGARHRRALGQLASNGASKRQLRRYVLAQAVVLGVFAAAFSILVGALLGAAAAKGYGHWSPTSAAPGPVDARWGWGLLLFGVAVFASLVAAYVPAIAASRLDLIEVLRGHVSRRRVRVGWPLAGLVLAVAGGAAVTVVLVSTTRGSPTDTVPTIAIVIGGIALFAGALLTVPWILAKLGMAAAVLPLPVRLAVRDISRQRGRAVATTGAILATMALLTTVAVAYTSVLAADRAQYVPPLAMGEGLITGGPGIAEAGSVVRAATPSATVVRLSVFGTSSDPKSQSRRLVAAGDGGCTDQQALAQKVSGGVGIGNTCSPMFIPGQANDLVVATPDELTRVFHLSALDRAALRDGQVLLPQMARNSTTTYVHLVAGSVSGVGSDGREKVQVSRAVLAPVARSTQPAFTFSSQEGKRGFVYPGSPAGESVDPAGLVSSSVVGRLPGGSSHLAGLVISAPGGFSQSQQTAMDERLPPGVTLYVERGPSDPSAWIFRLIAGVFALLVLVAALASTALSQSESRADSATFASLGAPARVRRLIAGANAAVVGLLGALLGVAVGLVPGVAVTHPLTIRDYGIPGRSGAVTVIPWGTLLLVAIGVPLLAAALAALATRGRVPMTRRVT